MTQMRPRKHWLMPGYCSFRATSNHRNSKHSPLHRKLQALKPPTNSLSIQTNLHLIEHKINKPNTDMVLKALSNSIFTIVELLTQENIKLYTQRHIARDPIGEEVRQLRHVDHEHLYWNIIVIALKIGRPAIASLVANQASYFYGSFRTSTILFVLYQLLKYHTEGNKVATCLHFHSKFEKVNKMATQKNQIQLQYTIMCKIIFVRLLLKLGLIEEAQARYMQDFGQESEQVFKIQQQQKNGLLEKQMYNTIQQFPFKLVQEFLHAEIQYNNGKNISSIEILGQIIANDFNLDDKYASRMAILAQNNLAVIMMRLDKLAVAKKYLQSASEKMNRLCNETQSDDTQKLQQYQQIKQNILYTCLNNNSTPSSLHNSSQHAINLQGYTFLDNFSFNDSYKLNYRKAQISLNYYHSLLGKNQRLLPWQQIHDSYDTIYYYPNNPYVQQKSKNRNVYFANKRHFYKRYILLNSWNDGYDLREEADKDADRRKFQRQVVNAKCKEVLEQTQGFLNQALIGVENQRNKACGTESFEGQFRQQINEVLYQEHLKFKCSILSILCYVQLCLCQWAKCIRYGELLMANKGLQSTEDYYNVLTYMLQAHCELGQFPEAYQLTHKLIRTGIKDDILHTARDSIGLHTCYYENSSELNTFLYNMAIIHSRDNHIPQSHLSIQKILSQMQLLPNSPNANMPLPLVDLLIHYNLRTQNYPSAIQMIKRKRILNMQGVNGIRPVFNITK